MQRFGLHLGWLAALLFALALAAFGATTPGFEHARHPIGLLGAADAPRALAYNGFVFALPGLALVAFALALERALLRQGLGRSMRLATGMLAIAALAFAAQALLPLDPRDFDSTASRRHAVAHSLALLAWLPAVLLLALATAGHVATRRWILPLALCAVALVLQLVWPASAWWPGWDGRPGWSQRLLLATWFAAPALLAALALRLPRAAPR